MLSRHLSGHYTTIFQERCKRFAKSIYTVGIAKVPICNFLKRRGCLKGSIWYIYMYNVSYRNCMMDKQLQYAALKLLSKHTNPIVQIKVIKVIYVFFDVSSLKLNCCTEKFQLFFLIL